MGQSLSHERTCCKKGDLRHGFLRDGGNYRSIVWLRFSPAIRWDGVRFYSKKGRTSFITGQTCPGESKYCQRIGHRIGKRYAMTGQQDCPKLVLLLVSSQYLF